MMVITNRPLALPWRLLRAYARDQRLSADDFQLFLRFVRALDDEYLTILAERRAGGSGGNEEEND
jgi:hypothetical protein